MFQRSKTQQVDHIDSFGNCMRGNHSMNRQMYHGNRKAAFTLIELMVVMAITVILLGLIFGPVVQSFNLTNRARVQVQTQDIARRLSETIQQDIAQAVFIFDNSNQPINFWMRTPDATGEPVGPAVAQPVSFAYMDLVEPARVTDQSTNLDPSLIDPTTGTPINRGDFVLPLSPGRVITRYFIGLRNNASNAGIPIRPYHNFYAAKRNRSLADHNTFVLYKAVVAPYTASGAVDTRFFRVNSAGNPILYDPNFFYDSTQAVVPSDPSITSAAVAGWKDDNGDGKVNISENWKALANPVVPVDRADEIVVQKSDNGQPLYFPDNATGPYTRLDPLIKFTPTYVGNDAGSPTSLSDASNEMPDVSPSSHKESYGHWTSPFNLYVYRGGLAGPLLNYFFWDGSTGPVQRNTYNTSSQASTSTSAGFFPIRFDQRSGRINVSNPPLDRTNPPDILLSCDTRRGVINFAFPDWIWLYDDASGLPKPSQWLNTAGAPDVATINAQFDAAYGLDSSNAKRYITLRTLPDGRPSPLDKIPNCQIVPGSEVVTGPDMRPGPHYGMAITYTRVPRLSYRQAQQLGANEYQINYSDMPGPKPALTGSAALDAMILNTLKAGSIIFCSRPADIDKTAALPTIDALGNPAAPITVTYQFQNNSSGDIVKADYLSRQLMTVSVGVRLYEFNSGQPQQVNISQKINVRNLLR